MTLAGNGERPTTYAIVAFLDLGAAPRVEKLRDKYDPLAQRVAAHLTLVHPFSTTLTRQALEAHLQMVSRWARPIALELQDVTGHQGEYLFLNLKRGNDEVIALRDALYTGPLATFREASVTFVPHVTVGRLSSHTQFQESLYATRGYTEPVATVLDRLSCYRIDDDGQRVILTQSQLSGKPSRSR